MVRLLGINVIYRYPMKGKKWTTYAELDANYEAPLMIGCIFDEHPNQQTLKKMGWISELQQDASVIHIAYDTPEIQQGCLFIIPSGLDSAEGRLFRVTRITNGIVYPASISCQLVPEYYDKYVPDISNHVLNSNLNLLNDEEDYQTWNQ